jgi:hypothetical protein
VSWDLKFNEPVQVPGKRKQLVTLRDAALYVTNLPKSEREAEHWRPAATLLGIIGERGGFIFSRNWPFGMGKVRAGVFSASTFCSLIPRR